MVLPLTPQETPRHRFPPIVRFANFLDETEHSALLQWVLANGERFQPAEVTDRGDMVVDKNVREALTLRGFDRDLPWLRQRFRTIEKELLKELRVTVPRVESLEMELAAHGDGAHFAPHLDIPVGVGRQPRGARPTRNDDRLFSAVYYFYREPKGFAGGHLRIHPFASEGANADGVAESYIDVEPEQNCLVAFPSWATHEVRTVACPTRSFADYRFAVNCWFCGSFQP